ncbi:hypothetical protein BN2476_110300 [Paraburkholderia piptadeniae]|uniref:Uncharacterized protein n=1 Tax=Paraburkholderia piptadeniae TaxID=1701573 RepID=A0A1N7RQR4_9BURK|nr:hypothetical protein BN2476_110300 [Paraburkholderia piptadeniae]
MSANITGCEFGDATHCCYTQRPQFTTSGGYAEGANAAPACQNVAPSLALSYCMGARVAGTEVAHHSTDHPARLLNATI